jgi:hypothetical protein
MKHFGTLFWFVCYSMLSMLWFLVMKHFLCTYLLLANETVMVIPLCLCCCSCMVIPLCLLVTLT